MPSPTWIAGVLFAVALAGAPARAQDFGIPVVLDPGQPVWLDPAVATDGAGNWVSVWTTPQLTVARSSNGGASWTTPQTETSISVGEPEIATGGGTWISVWNGPLFVNGGADIGVSRSTDAGATWSPATALDPGGAAEDNTNQSAQIATDGLGTWVAVWSSTDTVAGTIGADFDVLFSRSTDDGLTWTAPAPIDANAATDSASHRAGHVATDGLGTWLAVWTQRFGPDGVLVARSTDGGATWSTPTTVSTLGLLGGEPHLATDGSGNWVLVFGAKPPGTGTDIHFVRSSDSGVTWSAPAILNDFAMPGAFEVDAQPRVVWDSGSWLTVWLSAERLGEPITEFELVLKLMASRSTDGATWSSAEFLTLPIAHRPGALGEHDIASDGAGSFVAVWQTDDGGSSQNYVHASRSGVDTDGDGVLDDQEPTYGTNALLADTDADGLGDGLEVWSYGSDPLADGDNDGDGLSNADETNLYGTSPLLADTDGDGFDDGTEVAAGTDPTNPLSIPPIGPPVAGNLQDVVLRIDPASHLDMTITGLTSDTRAIEIEYGGSDARIQIAFEPGAGWVADKVTFLDTRYIFFGEDYWFEVELPGPPPQNLELDPRHWAGTFTPRIAPATTSGPGTASLDLAGVAYRVDGGEIDAYLNTIPYGIPASFPFSFAAGPTGTIVLEPDLSGYNMNVTLNVPIDGTDSLGVVDATLEGELVLTGRYAIPALPIPAWVALALAGAFGFTGRRLVATARSAPR